MGSRFLIRRYASDTKDERARPRADSHSPVDNDDDDDYETSSLD